MEENPDRDREEVPGRPAVSAENLREQAEEGQERRSEEGQGTLVARLSVLARRLFRGR